MKECSCNANKTEFHQAEVDLSLMEPIIEQYGQIKGSLINILQSTQEAYGFLPLDALRYIAAHTGNTLAAIYGVATFYTQFRLKPIGKYLILSCQGTACHVNGSREILKSMCEHLCVEPGETTADGLFTIEDVACLGCCSLAPAIMINGEAKGNLTPATAVDLLKQIQAREERERTAL